MSEAQVKAEIKQFAQADRPSDLVSRADLDADQRIPAGSSGQFVRFDASGNLEPTAAPGGTQGGLNQGQVRAEIKAYAQTANPTDLVSRGDLDPNQRIPAGSNGQHLQYDSSGNLTPVAAPTPGLSEAQVKNEIKGYAQADNALTLIGRNDLDANQRIPAGTNGQIVRFDSAGHLEATDAPETTDTYLEAASTLPAVADHESGEILDYLGEFYTLTTDRLHELTGTLGKSGSFFGGNNISGSTNFGTINGGITAEFAFPAEGFDPSPTYTVRLLLPKTVFTTQPNPLYIRFTLGDGQTVDAELHRSTANDTTNYWSYRGGSTRPYTVGAHLEGQTFKVEFYTDAALSTAFNFHSAKRWEPYNVAESKYIPPVAPVLHGTRPVISGSITGLSVTNSSSNFIQTLNVVSPAFTLSDAANQHGELHVEFVARLNTRSDTALSFDDASTLTRSVSSDLLFASTLRASEDWVSTTVIADLEGELIFTIPVYNGTTKRGELRLYLAHNSGDELGYVPVYVGETGTDTWSFGMDLNVNFVGSDVPATGDMGLDEAQVKNEIKPYAQADRPNDLVSRADMDEDQRIPAGANGQYLQFNASGNLVPVAAPSGGGATITPFARSATAAADVDITVPPSVAGAEPLWSDWTTVVALPAITAAEAGVVQCSAAGTGAEQNASSDAAGGDRVATEFRMVRVRSSTPTVIVTEPIYGPRNLNSSGATSAAFAAATNFVSGNITIAERAQTGDVYRMEARHLRQQPAQTVAKTIKYTAASTHMYVLGFGA